MEAERENLVISYQPNTKTLYILHTKNSIKRGVTNFCTWLYINALFVLWHYDAIKS